MTSKKLLSLLLLCAIISVTTSQKPGRCPPVRPGEVGICADTCQSDKECGGNQKCCRNGCGARVCRSPT